MLAPQPTNTLSNNKSDIRVLQALLSDIDGLYKGPIHGTINQALREAIEKYQKTRNITPRIKNKVNYIYPNGDTWKTLTAEYLGRGGKYSNLHAMLNSPEVYSCKDADFKLDSITSTQMPIPTKEAKKIYDAYVGLWKKYLIPLKLNKADFLPRVSTDPIKFNIRLSKDITWLEDSGNLTATMPYSVHLLMKSAFAAIGFTLYEAKGKLVASNDEKDEPTSLVPFIVMVGKIKGYPFAVENLMHYLKGSKADKTYKWQTLWKFNTIKETHSSIIKELEKQAVENGRKLAIGQLTRVELEAKKDVVGSDYMATDLYYGSGSSGMVINMAVTITREDDNNIRLVGKVTSLWSDSYDWDANKSVTFFRLALSDDEDKAILDGINITDESMRPTGRPYKLKATKIDYWDKILKL